MSVKTLIVYFSLSGTTAKMAALIKQVTNGDLVALTVAENTFSTDMFKTAAIAASQLETGDFPQLVNELPEFDQYDKILVGGPVWSSRVATPVRSFLALLSNATGIVAPFYTSTGTNSGYKSDFKAALKDTSLMIAPGIELTAGQLQQVDRTTAQLKKWSESLNLAH